MNNELRDEEDAVAGATRGSRWDSVSLRPRAKSEPMSDGCSETKTSLFRPFDSHCHLQDSRFDADRAQVLARARRALAGMVVAGDTLESSAVAVSLANEEVFASVGVHPHHAGALNDGMWDALIELAQAPGVVAIGETGLDYSRHSTVPPEHQRAAFVRHIELASALGLPVVIHNRDAQDAMAELLRRSGEFPPGVMHCFQGDKPFADLCLEKGLYLSFAGNITFPNAAALRTVVRVVPLDRLLIETDSPYLAPQPVRGKRCEPCFLQYTAEVLAETLGVPFEELARRTTENARRLFRIPRSS